jgi:hypothetical protein
MIRDPNISLNQNDLISLCNILQATKLDTEALKNFEKSHKEIDASLISFISVEIPEFSQTKLFPILCDYLLERLKVKKSDDIDLSLVLISFVALLEVANDKSKPEMILFEIIKLHRLTFSKIKCFRFKYFKIIC